MPGALVTTCPLESPLLGNPLMVDVVPFKTLPSSGGGIEESMSITYCFKGQ